MKMERHMILLGLCSISVAFINSALTNKYCEPCTAQDCFCSPIFDAFLFGILVFGILSLSAGIIYKETEVKK